MSTGIILQKANGVSEEITVYAQKAWHFSLQIIEVEGHVWQLNVSEELRIGVCINFLLDISG
jgi:hypothetical protein